MTVLLKLLLAFAPLLGTAAIGWLAMEGVLNFGGGEKDIFIVVPLLLWSLVYLLCYCICWWRRFATTRSVRLSVILATLVLIAAWLALFTISGA